MGFDEIIGFVVIAAIGFGVLVYLGYLDNPLVPTLSCASSNATCMNVVKGIKSNCTPYKLLLDDPSIGISEFHIWRDGEYCGVKQTLETGLAAGMSGTCRFPMSKIAQYAAGDIASLRSYCVYNQQAMNAVNGILGIR